MTNRQIELEGVTNVDDLEFQQLEPNYLKVHIVMTILMYLVLMGFALFLLLTEIMWICIAAECALLVAAAVNLPILSKACRFKGYALREQDITYRSGIFFPKTTTVPYSKIQQVSVTQNPVTRFYHLYSVDVVNGAQSMSSLSIPGLTEMTANEIKNLITDKLRDTHD